MASNRILLINEEIQKELSALLRSVKDPRVQDVMISITRVETTPDLRYTKVYVSFLQEDKANEAMKGLNLQPQDVVVGLSAAGGAAFVLGTLEYAKEQGCATAGITCNPDTPITKACDMPIVVLTDETSASASEIFAGAIQDNDRGTIVGRRTFGKGLVQSTRPVSGGGHLKLTTAKYYIPSGRCVQALDYSHMIEDGKTTRVPDSLTNVFHTAAGREVRDGGGIRPDIEPKSEELSTLLFYLMQDMTIFDFATEYTLKHDTIAPAETFEITDQEYEEFKKLLKSRNFSYDLISVKVLKDLKEAVKFEGFSDIVKEEIASLEKKLQANLDHSLTHFEKEIRKIIADEIIPRYHGQKGRIIYSLREDTDLSEAYRILKDEKEYKEILAPTKK